MITFKNILKEEVSQEDANKSLQSIVEFCKSFGFGGMDGNINIEDNKVILDFRGSNAGDDNPSEEAIEQGRKIYKAIKEKFGSSVKMKSEFVDEWIFIEIFLSESIVKDQEDELGSTLKQYAYDIRDIKPALVSDWADGRLAKFFEILSNKTGIKNGIVRNVFANKLEKTGWSRNVTKEILLKFANEYLSKKNITL
jgi:hypothetical protein